MKFLRVSTPRAHVKVKTKSIKVVRNSQFAFEGLHFIRWIISPYFPDQTTGISLSLLFLTSISMHDDWNASQLIRDTNRHIVRIVDILWFAWPRQIAMFAVHLAKVRKILWRDSSHVGCEFKILSLLTPNWKVRVKLSGPKIRPSFVSRFLIAIKSITKCISIFIIHHLFADDINVYLQTSNPLRLHGLLVIHLSE